MGTLHRLPLPARTTSPKPRQSDRHEELTRYVACHDSTWDLAALLFDLRDAFEELERSERVLEMRAEQHLDTRQERAAVRDARERIKWLLPKVTEAK